MKWTFPFVIAGVMAFVPAVAPAATIDNQAEQALMRALADEYNAEAFYAAVIETFGPVRPFSNIIEAERMHASALVDLMRGYGIDVPPNDKLGAQAVEVEVPATLKEACLIGVEAEILNRDLYTKDLMPAAAGYPDILRVFDGLQAASENNHLPAFQRCAQRN